MISTIVISVLLCSCYSSAQIPKNITVPEDDQANWAKVWNAINANSDGRSGASQPSDVFDRILRSNARARHQVTARSGDTEFLFQGDIAMDRNEVSSLLNASGTQRRKRAVMKKYARRLWKSNIPYTLSTRLGTRAKQVILQAIKEWERALPCLGTWKDVTKVRKRNDYIRFIKGKGCYSKVGRRAGGQSLSIGSGCDFVGVVIHEIGHAMGFWHEQSRNDRDSYVTIHWDNIIPKMKFNFEKFSTSKINSLKVPYDYNSVMHYGSTAFSKNNRKTISIKSKDPNILKIKLGQRRGLSDYDKKQARLLYDCKVTAQALPCDSSPCLNGAVCKNYVQKFVCSCPSGYSGVRCEKKKVVVTGCTDGDSRCAAWGKAGFCKSGSGYKLYMYSKCCKTCRSLIVKSLPCKSSPCLNGGVCSNQGTKFSCKCKSDYTGARCEQNSCRDQNSNCNSWKKYCSADSKYYRYMLKNCCKTCQPFKSVCVDKNVHCSRWMRAGFCTSTRYKAYMQGTCKKSCGC